jgi:hypothetical protein
MIDLYGKGEFIIPYGLVHRLLHIVARQNLRKVSIIDAKCTFEGFLGEVAYSGELTRLMPYIDLGSVMHMGKLKTRGFGQYTFQI